MAVINGTPSSETLNGTAGNDELAGDAGNDTLLGGAGVDTAIYSGNSFDYRFGWSDGHLTVTDLNAVDGEEGMDSLLDIEKLQFADRTFDVTPGGVSRANSTQENLQSSPAVTQLSDGGWVTTWAGKGIDDGMGIFCQRYNMAGNPVGSELRINSTTHRFQDMPSVTTLSDGGWLVAWMGNDTNDNYDIFTQRYDATGTTVGSETRIAASTTNETYPSVTSLPDGGWLASWESSGKIFSRRYDADNKPVGSETLVSQSSTPHSSSTTGLPDGGWVVSWYEIDAQQTHIGHTVLQRYDSDGEPTGARVSFGNFAHYTHPSVTTLTDGGWLVAWRGFDAIYVKRYDASNAPTGPATQIPASGGDASAVGLADGGWLITSSDYDFAQTTFTRFDASGRQIAVISSDERSGLQTAPAVITPLADGGWLATWEGADEDYTGIFSQRYNAQGEAQYVEIHGTDQADVLSGQSPLALSGGAGDDIYIIETAAAVVRERANEGIDTVYSHLSSYTLTANVENGRILATGPGAITGNELNNVLYAGTGESGYGYVLNGGAGVDTASFAYSKIAVTAQINFPANMINPAYNSLNDIENLTGSDYNDFLGGDLGSNVIDGGLGADKMTGGDGSDTYYVDNVGDEVNETNPATGGGTDTVYSYLTSYTLGSNIENGRILSSSAASLTGNSLNNILYAGSGDNLLNGASGVDTVSYLYATSAIHVSLAITTAQATQGSGTDTLVAIENLNGSAYNDSLTGNAANNTLNGGSGSDTLNGGAGIDTMIGGNGSDIYFVDNANDVVSETNANALIGGTDIVNSYLTQYTLGANIENGRVLTSDAANMTGNSLNNIIFAGAGNNVLNGGSGNDTLSYLYASSSVTVSLANMAAQATGGSGTDTLSSFENLSGSFYNDNLTGNASNNKLEGGLGNDALNGGAGADNMVGGDGSDTYYVDHAGDIVSETNADAGIGGIDSVLSNLASYILGANIENGRVLATGAANLTGNTLGNVLTAGNGNNVLNGGDGVDTASYAYATSAVTINLANTSAQATGGSGSDTLLSIENLVGSNYNDTLIGNAASNKLNGGAGHDRLIGGAGKDILVGGSGNDIFEFGSLADTGLTSDSWDVINDFVRGTDKIDLSKLDANTATAGDNTFNMIIDGAAAFTAARQLKLLDGVLYGNTDGDSNAEFAIQLIGVTSVSLADFIA